MKWCKCQDETCIGCLIRTAVIINFGTLGEQWLNKYIESHEEAIKSMNKAISESAWGDPGNALDRVVNILQKSLDRVNVDKSNE